LGLTLLSCAFRAAVVVCECNNLTRMADDYIHMHNNWNLIAASTPAVMIGHQQKSKSMIYLPISGWQLPAGASSCMNQPCQLTNLSMTMVLLLLMRPHTFNCQSSQQGCIWHPDVYAAEQHLELQVIIKLQKPQSPSRTCVTLLCALQQSETGSKCRLPGGWCAPPHCDMSISLRQDLSNKAISSDPQSPLPTPLYFTNVIDTDGTKHPMSSHHPACQNIVKR